MKSTVVIAYAPGAYGTYLEWCLTTLTSNDNIIDPLTNGGSSHKFVGNHLDNILGWRNYVSGHQEYAFVRLHPKASKDGNIADHFAEIANNAQHIIYLYPDESTNLLTINNYFYKIWDSWLLEKFRTDIDPSKIYNNWPVDKSTPLDQIPQWILREFLSFYLMPAWFDQIEWRAQQSYPKSIVIPVSDLLFDFENVLSKIEKFCNLNYQKSASSLLSAHQKMLLLQKYTGQDQLCNNIIDSVIHQINFDWKTLPLPSEAWIQWRLRELGQEIRCHGLDMFPTNSIQLKELLYAI